MSSKRSPSRTDILLESEARELLASLDIALPDQIEFTAADSAAAAREICRTFAGSRVVIKVASRDVLHKSEIGGVSIVQKQAQTIADAVARMAASTGIETFIGCEFIEHDSGPAGELLLGIRYTTDFGPVVSLAVGGIATEFFAKNIRPGREIAIFSPDLRDRATFARALESKAFTPFLIHGIRNQRPLMTADALYDLIERCLDFAAQRVPGEIAEMEINPLVPTPRGLFALDAVVRPGGVVASVPANRPIEKINALLHPRSVAVVGVSRSRNPGRVIVANLIKAGFDRSSITIVKPGEDEIEGCRCVADIASLPGRVDLLVLTIAAEQIPAAIDDAVALEKAESIIIIPGGLGEHAGSESLEEAVRRSIAASRRSLWRGPVVNGGNCLGVHSIPGRCNTIFLPEEKLERGPVIDESLAIISQSGALAVALTTRLAPLAPCYVVSIGNQVDLTVGDYLQYLASDSVDVLAFYVEGFRPLDGARWLRAAGEATRRGKTVILYRAGRTTAGTRATATHTAAIAGDAVVSRELATAAGAIVAETLEEFEDLIRTATLLRGRRARGTRLVAMSNAGFESVAYADNLGPFTLATLGEETREKIGSVLRASRLDRIVTVGNPLDVNPMLDDAAFAEVAAALLNDPAADAAIIGVVPLTGALLTLPAEIGAPESIVNRLTELWRTTTKPWACVVEAGPLYDAMRTALAAAGIPTFQTADRAIRALGRWCGR
jgi:acyl-CoA synthetase (NDP forming)